MQEAYIIDAVRTPRGRRSRPKKDFYGEFAEIHPATLGATLVNALLERNTNLVPETVEDLFYSTVIADKEQAANMGRTVVLASELPETTSGITMNRACSGALQANAFANATIKVGDYDILMAGGGEHMNMCPIDGAMDYDHLPFPQEVFDNHNLITQGQSAEMICEKYNLNQAEIDEFSVRSHELAHAATEAGKFKNEIIPIPYKDKDGNDQVLDWDSNIRQGTTVEKITALPRPFKEGGLMHAASSSAIVDGSSLLLWASGEACKKYGFKPKAKILSNANAGVHVDIMLDGVIPGTELALKKAGLTIDDIDIFEINEAFASVPVAWMNTLNIPMDKVNVNGGAIAMGHPLGATGGILMATMLNEMERQDYRYGLITMCAAYGQSGTMILERVK
jgi:acetyl-CoA acetyltransferase family protein